MIENTLFIHEGNAFKEKILIGNHFESMQALIQLANEVQSEYFFIKTKPGKVSLNTDLVKAWMCEAVNSDTSIGYSHYFQLKEKQNKSETIQEIPTNKYQLGSIRDDFNFGALLLIKKAALISFLNDMDSNFAYAGLYSFRLWASRKGKLSQHAHYTYTYTEPDIRASGQKQFDYVDPQNRNRQIEMEQAATYHLRKIGALLTPPFHSADLKQISFDVEASVIIPVLNREKTIADAIQSVLNQNTNFRFNIIVVDNHSTDKTGELIDEFNCERLIRVIPEERGLGIGGCWNVGVNHPQCGKFAIQLDSDDLYAHENTLHAIVDKFYEQECAMVIGSYRMVDFDLKEIPPGIIDHCEWTNSNGPNNALRINGLGAPRAFYTPVIRKIGFPNVSYGEDYAVALAISRQYKIGRIYEPIYLCRRWENNTDSNLPIEKINAHNAFKDSLRTKEIETRIQLNNNKHK